MPSQKEKIIEVATKLFLEKWYEKTSTSKLIKESWISRGWFYHHFSTKENLLDEVIENIKKDPYHEIQKIFNNKDLSPPEKIINRMNYEKKFFDKNNDLFIKILTNQDLKTIKDKLMTRSKCKFYPLLLETTKDWINKWFFNIESPEETVILIMWIFETISLTENNQTISKEKRNRYINSASLIIKKIYNLD